MSIRFPVSSPCLLVLLALCLFDAAPRRARADRAPPIHAPPLSLSHRGGFVGDDARSDAIGIHLGTSTATRFNGERRFAGLSGWTHGALTFLDVATIGGAIGGHFARDEDGVTHTASAPAMLFAKLRVYPGPWRAAKDGGLQVAVSYQRSFVSERLGKDEPPGFDLNTVRVLATRTFGPVELDAGVGAIFGGAAPDLRRSVEASFTASLRIYGLVQPPSPDEQLKVSIQALYRFALPGSGGPSEGYVLAGVHESTASGYRFGLGIGPQVLGAQVGGLFMAQFSVSWGLRYRNPWAESIAGKRKIPRLWMDLFYIDPILREDGCVYTEPSRGVAPLRLKCLGTPDPKNPGKVMLYTNGYVSTPLRLWSDDKGELVDQEGFHLGRLDEEQVPWALAAQELAQRLHEVEHATGQTCAYRADMLRGVRDLGLASVLAGGDGGAAALMAAELGRAIQCGDPKELSGGGFLPLLGRLPLGKGPKAYRGPLLGRGEAEHVAPVQPVGEPLSNKTLSHVCFGEVNSSSGKARGWHHRSSGDPNKGTYVIEESMKPKDKFGVYEANVVIEGTKKNALSSFFPDEWSQAQVKSAILEAYKNRQVEKFPGVYIGTTAQGMQIEMWVDKQGKIMTAYPVYQGK